MDLKIEREVVIDAPADVVWRTITEPEEIVRWFSDDAELVARPGGNGAFVFRPGSDTEVRAPFVIEDVDRPRRFVFRWAHPEGEAPNASNSVRVEFTLVAITDEQTRLRVEETGLQSLTWSAADKSSYAEDHNEGWARHFARLEDLLTSASE